MSKPSNVLGTWATISISIWWLIIVCKKVLFRESGTKMNALVLFATSEIAWQSPKKAQIVFFWLKTTSCIISLYLYHIYNSLYYNTICCNYTYTHPHAYYLTMLFFFKSTNRIESYLIQFRFPSRSTVPFYMVFHSPSTVATRFGPSAGASGKGAAGTAGFMPKLYEFRAAALQRRSAGGWGCWIMMTMMMIIKVTGELCLSYFILLLFVICCFSC